MRVVIVADSPEGERELVVRCAAEADRLIVTDGGIRHLPAGIVPHVICGDFDSLPLKAARERFPFVDFVHLPDQSSNDLEKALGLALSQGATDVVIVSGLGGRPDQSFVTLLLLAAFSDRVNIEARHAGMTCRVIGSGTAAETCARIPLSAGDVVSVLPFGAPAVVSMSGVEWPVQRELFELGSKGVSNRARSDEVVVTVHTGAVLLTYTTQP